MASGSSVLFNPSRYETVYGVSLFDDLHNYLPEILYDSELFQSPMISFLQRRIQTLFESDFVQNRTRYRMFQQTQRRLTSGIFTTARHVHTPAPFQEPIYTATATTVPITSPISVASVMETLTPPRTGVSSLLQTPPRIQRRNPIRTQTAFLDPNNLGSGLSALLLSAITGSEDSLAQFMNFDPVPVRPTEDQLQRATFLTIIEPPNDVVCSICQDHASEENTSGEWRYIRHCNHAFHRTCIDHWFQEHVQCPVCRFDIREHPPQAES